MKPLRLPKFFYPAGSELSDDPQRHAKKNLMNSMTSGTPINVPMTLGLDIGEMQLTANPKMVEAVFTATAEPIPAVPSAVPRTQPESHVTTPKPMHFLLNARMHDEPLSEQVDTIEKPTIKTTRKASKTFTNATTPNATHHNKNRDLRRGGSNKTRNVLDDEVEVSALKFPSNLLLTLNGTCDDIEHSQAATNQFVLAFERSMARLLLLPDDHIHVWEITCGSLIVNFSISWMETADSAATFDQLQQLLANFAFFWSGTTYATDFKAGIFSSFPQ